MLSRQQEHWLHKIFDVAIVIKGIDGAIEIIVGIVLAAFSSEQIRNFLRDFTLYELEKDPHDVLFGFIQHLATSITPHAKWVAMIYLLCHGCLKVVVALQLIRGKLWAYPFAMAVLVFFIVVQTTDVVLHRSVLLAGLTCLDAAILAMAWHKYRLQRTA